MSIDVDCINKLVNWSGIGARVVRDLGLVGTSDSVSVTLRLGYSSQEPEKMRNDVLLIV